MIPCVIFGALALVAIYKSWTGADAPTAEQHWEAIGLLMAVCCQYYWDRSRAIWPPPSHSDAPHTRTAPSPSD